MLDAARDRYESVKQEQLGPRGTRWFFLAFVAYVLALLLSLGMRWSSDWRPLSLEARGDLIQEGNALRRIALFGLAAVAAMLLAKARRTIGLRNGAVVLAWAGFLTLGLASAAWSVDPALTFRRVTVLLILAFASAAFTHAYGMKGLAALVVTVAGAVTAAGITAWLWLGTLGPLVGRFGGVVHPVTESWHCSLMVLACLGLALWYPRYRRFFLVAAAFGFLGLLATRTRTSLAATMAAGVVFEIMTVRHKAGTLLMVACGSVMSVGALVLLLAVSFPSTRNAAVEEINPIVSLGRQESTRDLETLTARTLLWNYLLSEARERPYFGYGYDSFFSSRRLATIADAATWDASSEHSMYLETFLGLGGVGLAALVSTFALAFFAIVNRWAGTVDGAFAASILVWTMIVGFFEASVATTPVLPTLSWMGVLGWVALRNVQDPGHANA